MYPVGSQSPATQGSEQWPTYSAMDFQEGTFGADGEVGAVSPTSQAGGRRRYCAGEQSAAAGHATARGAAHGHAAARAAPHVDPE